MTLGGALVTSLLVALARPALWMLGLAGFLVRGGVLLILAPIVVLPTAAGLANVVAPLLEDIAFGRRTAELAVLVAWVVVGLVAWLVGGGLLAGAAEAELVRRVARDDEFAGGQGWASGGAAADGPSADAPGRPRAAGRILAARLLAAVPLAVALAWGATRVVAVAYRELTVPSETSTPLAVRVIGGAPEAVGALVLAWLLAEILGAVATRRIVLGGEGPLRALVGGLGAIGRRPVRTLVLALVPLAQLVVVVAAIGLAGSATWDALRAALATDDGTPARWLLLGAFVGLFVAGLVLIGVTSAWRSAVWTVDAGGTFGAGSDTPLGFLEGDAASGTLGDRRVRGLGPDRGEG